MGPVLSLRSSARATRLTPPPLPGPQVAITPTLHPTYFLFVAPPSAAAIAWASVSGSFDTLARSLYFVALFMYFLVAVANHNFLRSAPFSLSWWAYTFPCECPHSRARAQGARCLTARACLGGAWHRRGRSSGRVPGSAGSVER